MLYVKVAIAITCACFTLIALLFVPLCHPSATYQRGQTEIMSWGAALKNGYHPVNDDVFKVKAPSSLIYFVQTKIAGKPTMLLWQETGEAIGYKIE